MLSHRPHQRRRERDVQPPGLGPGDPRQLLCGGDRPAPRALDRQERAQRALADDDSPGAARFGREVDPHRELVPDRRRDRNHARGTDDARARAQGRHREERMHARAPAPRAAAAAPRRGGRPAGRPAALRRGPRRVHGRPLVHAPERLPIAHPAREPRSLAGGSDRARRRHVRRLRRLRRGRPRGRALSIVLRGEGDHEPELVDAVRGSPARGRHPPTRGRRDVTDAPLLSLLVPAVGGQGGGVLLDWIVDAALIDGYPVHGTSIPGVAQRTGSTTYYVELSGERNPASDGTPIFSLYPVPGALDVLLAPEFLEVGRSIELGFPSPGRPTIIASTHRLYSIHEKIVTGRGIYPIEKLQAAARAFSKRLIAFDALALAREHGTEANAVLLGALAGSGVLPLSGDSYREAIRAKGVFVDANLRGFEAGFAVAAGGAAAGAREGSGASRTPLASDPSRGLAAVPPVSAVSPDIEAM